MPEIDTELFQQIALGLLALLLLVGLLVLNSLGKIRKTLEKGVVARPGEAHDEPISESGAADQREVAPAAEEPAAASSDTYSPWSQPAQEPAAVAAEETPTASGSAAVETIPEEQPFERDGRWWFKRGDELLVYDEQTGQWTAAPADAPITSSPSSADTGAGPATQEMPATSAAAEGGFWKCPSCGAVNGSTSATCRMCFTPRPA